MTEGAAVGRAIYLGPWRVDLTIRSGVARLLPGAVLARSIRAALEAAGAPSPASIGLILSTDLELAELNETHLGKVGPTDVLSFPLLPPPAFRDHPGKGSWPLVPSVRPPAAPAAPGAAPAAPAGVAAAGPAFVLPPDRRPHLGDIVVSVERAQDQAMAGRGGQTGDVHWSPADELRLLVLHGALHVCGWDHAEPEEEAAMRTLEGQLLGA